MWAGISRHAVHIAAASAGCRTASVGTGSLHQNASSVVKVLCTACLEP